MASSADDKKRPFIPAEDAEEFSRWRMPEMSPAQRERLVALAQKPRAKKPQEDPLEIVDEPLYAEKLTLAEWERIREEAYQDGFKQGQEEGKASGYETGLAEGKTEGLKQAQSHIDQEVGRVKALIDQLQHPLASQEKELHLLIRKLVVNLARAIVEHEFEERPELLLATIERATALIPSTAETPVLSLHPEDCVLIRATAEREGWELREDPRAKRGDLQLIAGSCRVTQNLEQRIEQVAGNLFKSGPDEKVDGSA